MRGNKRDAVERDVIKALRDAGCLVMQLDKFDLLVQRPFAEHMFMLEVKTGNASLKPSQTKLMDDGWRLQVVRSPEEALRAVGL